MSQETMNWLNTMTLIGFTEKRGNAWHYRQGSDNHFPGPIPIEVIRKRLFNWKPIEGDVRSQFATGDHLGNDQIVDPDRKTIIRPENAIDSLPTAILGIFSQDYRVHDYEEWLVKNVETILDDTLAPGSAGLLKGGAQAWVQAEMPETVVTPDGVAFRPFITAATSLDGSMATTYFSGNNLVVCDNTLHAARHSAGRHTVRRRHTSGSLGSIPDVREALGIIYEDSKAFTEEISQLIGTTVTDEQWSKFLNEHAPLPDPVKTKGGGPGRGWTVMDRKRNELRDLYYGDPRVAPWSGTAFGVLQAVNTWSNHVRLTRGMDRPQRNAERMLSRSFEREDAEVLDTLGRVLAS